MDEIDRDLEKAEREASPDRFPPYKTEDQDGIHRARSGSSGTISTSATSVIQEEMGMSRGESTGISRQTTMLRVNTRDLERHPTALSRINTHRSQHLGTVGRTGTTATRDSKRPLPEFGGGKPYPPPLPHQEEYVVEFDGPHDPLHPQNWPIRKKILTAVMLGFTTLISAFTSSIFSAATQAVARSFHVSNEVGVLGLSLYVLGFATGPLLWAPLSELRGRRLPLVLSMFGFSIFQIGVAVGKDLQTVLLCRFFGGLFAACPLAVVAAVFSDMFDNRTRGLAITVFSMSVFSGPLLAPFIGGFITMSYLGWRWTEYLVAIIGFTAFGMNLIFLEETYPPVVLIGKASELRRRTKNWGIHAKQEEIEVDFRELMNKNFSRPLRILVTEPIVLLLSIYMAFIYGLLYLFLTAYPIVYQRIHHMNLGVGGLPYFGIITGQLLAGFVIVLLQPSYNRKLAANNNVPIPEWRLPPVIAGGASFALGLFWFGWSGYRADIHWIVPTLSGILTGFGLLAIFLQALNYIVDAYLMFAASAIAANTFLRSLAGAVFPLFATYMFDGMGVQWASTLLGCVAAALVPIPIIFWKYGGAIRSKSKFAPTWPKTQEIETSSDE
ncbi:mfs dha1 multidrug resistance protein [Lasallia pustulata]|uniref:Mfs dha1 multidrug resistance protein n=1 Tax=Lasallia pustulata TaxID=136370 RepID=A0A1W5CTD0_9LECA|nr:mfs dha1 multidrug resistance protein [Lasallia pustulata]